MDLPDQDTHMAPKGSIAYHFKQDNRRSKIDFGLNHYEAKEVSADDQIAVSISDESFDNVKGQEALEDSKTEHGDASLPNEQFFEEAMYG